MLYYKEHTHTVTHSHTLANTLDYFTEDQSPLDQSERRITLQKTNNLLTNQSSGFPYRTLITF